MNARKKAFTDFSVKSWKTRRVHTKGTPARLQIACVIASRQGVEHLAKLFPGDDVTLWCAAIDTEMNEHSYIVPGLGDAGDLAFGDKI